MAALSSGTPIPVVSKLGAALRWLAGGSHLDICVSFQFSWKSFGTVVYSVLGAIDQVRDNIHFPFDEEACESACRTFDKFSGALFPGTVAAGDGVVFQIARPLATFILTSMVAG
jgi:hypothetical protein